MAVEVLSPKDCLKDSLLRQSVTNFNQNPNPSCLGHPSRPQPNCKNRRPNRPNNLPRLVKILKRGEEIPKTALAPPLQKQNPKHQALDFRNTNRMGPETKRVPKLSKQANPNRIAGFYAGLSSCIASPPPSSLRLPPYLPSKTSPLSPPLFSFSQSLRKV
ncbi:unnamed protein product [Malus baccata var. baccata]